MPVWLAAASVAAVLALALIPSGAGAVVAHPRSGRPLSFKPLRHSRALMRLDKVAPFNLDYSGGPIMPSNTNYLIYWRPSTAEKYPAKYQEGIDRYFEDLAHDSGGTGNVDSVATQYNDAAGEFANYQSTYGGELVDEHAYPANGCTQAKICLSEKQLEEELTRFVKEKKLPTDLTHEYFLLTPPKVESCFEEIGFGPECSAGAEEDQAYCAYHGNIELEGGAELIYANDPYVAGNLGCEEGISPNGSPSDGELQGGLSHEHNESITDPEPNNAWTDLFGGAENGDKCDESTGSALGKAPNGESYNQVINGHFYWYQEEWSNQGRVCLQRLTFAGVAPQARFGITGGSANEVHFDGSASIATGGVAHYDWQPNDPPEGTTTESTAPTLTHKFSKKGTYDVALAVFASDGTSAGTACTVTVPISDEAPTASFAAPAEVLAPATAVHFDGSASGDEDGTIKSYTWSFGDGTPAVSGATPIHEYAADGEYKVKLTVIDSDCMESSVTHTVKVDEPPTAAIALKTLTPIAESAVAFEAKASDPDGTISGYSWNFGDGSPPSTEANPSHTYAAAGEYEVTLKVTDSSGQTATATRKVSVHTADELPTVTIVVGGEAVAGSPLHFDGSSSSDPDGEITSFAWSFGDGGESSEAAPSHTYAAAGSYEAMLTVTDSEGLKASATRTITVAPAPVLGGGGGLGGGPFGGGEGTTPPPPPPPPPSGKPAALTGTLSLLATTLPVHSGRAIARVRCAGTAPSCSGRLVLRVKARLRVRGRLQLRSLTLASSTFTIRAGRSSRVRLVLSSTGRARLRTAGGRLVVRLALVRTSPAPALTRETAVRLQGR
jgi:PKD repeat protein